MRIKRTVLFALVGLAVWVSGAEAREFNRDEMTAVRLANDYWGSPPPCDSLQLEAIPESDPSLNGRVGSALNDNGACSIWLADTPPDPDPIVRVLHFATVCLTVAHEFGHLRGLEHSSDPSNVMWADGDISDIRALTPGCKTEERRRLRIVIAAENRAGDVRWCRHLRHITHRVHGARRLRAARRYRRCAIRLARG